MLTRSAAYLLIAALAALSLLFVACGDGPDDSASAAGPGDSGTVEGEQFPVMDLAADVPADQRNVINVVPAGLELAVGPNNFVFGITDKQDIPQGGADALVTFYDLKDPSNPEPFYTTKPVQSAPGVGPEVTHVHGNGETHVHGGEDDGRVGYYVDVNFPHAGQYGVAVKATLKDGSTGVSSFGFQVYEKPRIPAPGQDAPKSDNLTKNDVADIREIDSGDPPNDMHDVKIKDAIAAERPLLVVFSTPAFCTSRFCGPVNEEVESLQEDYRDRVDFVHIEIWRDFDKKELNPTTREWLVREDGGLSEPFVYVVGKDGVIYDRWEGPVARNIMESSVQAVADGKVWGQ
ncbi:MAG: hypothetical protein M0R74_07625 [Dehalococcoidia bacterium]|nr:hypothetical protein [Dehalococcoidia bacterium]